jgi:hypothetical protein
MVGSLACRTANDNPRAAKSPSCAAIIALSTPRRVRSARTPTPSTAATGTARPPGTAISVSNELTMPIGSPPSNAANLCSAGQDAANRAQEPSVMRRVCNARRSRSSVLRRSSSVIGRTSKAVILPILPPGTGAGTPF